MTEKRQKELEKKAGLDFYNDLLKKQGISARLRIDDDGEGGYELVVKEGNRKTAVSCGLNEDEMVDEVMTMYYEITRKKYVVTYVGLSDSDPDGNGYCEVKICSERHIAERVAKELEANELDAHDEDIDVKHENGVTVLSWAGGSEKVIISIHEERVKWV